jgi:exosortase/archaeosortase family protein
MTAGIARPSPALSAAVRQVSWRAVALVALVLLAYNYSLLTLARGLGLQTPLAYLALVPLMAVGLAVARVRLGLPATRIHDRQLDWIVGLGLLGAAAAILVLMPTATDAGFWLRRTDLLTLPLYVAGLVVLLFGVRRAWALKAPIAFLLLAWPVPYTIFLAGAMGWFTDVTAQAVGMVTNVVPLARPSPTDPTLLFVGTGPALFSVSISSACAGVNGLVGFLLVGTAMLYLVRGPLARRIAWLAFGLGLVFVLNVLRIVAILAVGVTLGQEAAFEVLHPVAGMVVFNVGVVAMVMLVRRFGLRFVSRTAPGAEVPARSPIPVRRAGAALAVAIVFAVGLAITNASFARFEAISAGLGDARLSAFDVRTAELPGWGTRPLSSFPVARQYFGNSATWDRTLAWPTESAALASSRNVYLDVVTTDDAGSFAAYSIEACYRFHGYRIESITTADVGAGVRAQVIDYHNTKVDADWSILAWEWPYQDVDGSTRYQRIALLMSEGPAASFRGVAAPDVRSQAAPFNTTDQFLVTLARTLVRSQLAGVASAAVTP